MAEAARFRDRHPLCTCPRRTTFPGVIEQQPDCPGGTIAHPPPLTREQLDQILAGGAYRRLT